MPINLYIGTLQSNNSYRMYYAYNNSFVEFGSNILSRFVEYVYMNQQKKTNKHFNNVHTLLIIVFVSWNISRNQEARSDFIYNICIYIYIVLRKTRYYKTALSLPFSSNTFIYYIVSSCIYLYNITLYTL